MRARSSSRTPSLAGLAVQWGERDEIDRLIAGWGNEQPGYPLVVVDNGPRFEEPPASEPWLRWVSTGHNLGFAGGIRYGLGECDAERILILNPDARPLPGALAELEDGFARYPGAAALAPRLIGPSGETQHRWQLRPLPTSADLLAQCLFLARPRGPRREPQAGALLQQPAAAALAIGREPLEHIGGFDPGYHPAWFEDVDLARRLADDDRQIRYWPRSEVRHRLGASVPALGYGPFLWLYYRHLVRYAGIHLGAATAGAARALLLVSAPLRLLTLPLRRPRRARSRASAAHALTILMQGAASGWRRPHTLASRFAVPEFER